MDWFYTFRDKDEWIVMGGSALEHIKNDLRDPNAQRPSITLFIGNETKTAAQKSMFPANSFSVSSGEGVARLYAESSTTDGVEPRLIGDISVCSSSSGCNNSYRPPRDQPNLVHYRIEWPLAQSHGLSHDCVMNATLSQVVFMFVDVVCLFLDDFATQKDGLDFFERWIKPQGRFWKWKPKVIVVTNREPVPNIEEARQVTLIAKPSNTSIYRSLQKSILHDLNIVRRDRNACRMAFSATHLVAFFELALRHISKSVIEKFDFIHASRQFNEIDERFESHLTNFLRLCFKNSASNQFSIRYIASAMVMDSFPPGMHHFLPCDIFASVYYRHCYRAFSAHHGAEKGITPVEFCKKLEAQYSKMHAELSATMPARRLHQKNIQSYKIQWQSFKSSRTCLLCLRRAPEHVLRCGHSICDTCTRIFGVKEDGMEYSYRFTRCLLCDTRAFLKIRIKPPTAGSRLLVLDGGGIRGSFTLQALQALERHRRLPYPIYDEFDLSLGTSSGGLIVLMFLLRHSVEECATTFKRLARRVFRRPCRFRSALLGRIHGFILSLVTDSLYGAANFEACVREAYGEDTNLFGNPGWNVSGSKYAVTTMTVSDSRLCILSNYNGLGRRRKECGYKHFRPVNSDDEVRIREAARATSAAPSYFPAKFIRGLGFVQDGGAGKHNNPIDPAEWESRAIWGVGPDVVLSIGTGYERLPESPELVPQRLRLRDRFFPRLFRLFEAVLNAQSNWNDHLNRVNEEQRHKYIRINMPLHEEPGLDEVSKIPEMEKASASFLEAYDFLSVTQALFAVSFFFELHGKPQPEPDGAWLICYGAIHCRSPDTRAFMSRLLDEYPTASFCTGEGTSLGLLDDCELCMMCGHYCKRVTFIICHPDQNVSVYLRFNRLRKHRISGFPQAISYFAKQQLLDAHFGRPDHEVMNGERQHQCTYKIGKKRKREGNSDIGLPSPVRKRQRRIPSKYLLRNSDNDQLNEDN